MRVMNFATKRHLPVSLVRRLTCVGFSPVDFIVNVHGKFFKLMVTQLKYKKGSLLSSSNNRAETKLEDGVNLLSYRLELLLRSFGKL